MVHISSGRTFFCHADSAKWKSAESSCQTSYEEGHLIHLEDKDMMDAVGTYCHGIEGGDIHYWIGLTDFNCGGNPSAWYHSSKYSRTLCWTDGEKNTYAYDEGGEVPNDQYGDSFGVIRVGSSLEEPLFQPKVQYFELQSHHT